MNTKQVLDHLTAMPDREDTLEGLTNWWMKSNNGRHALDELEETLNVMLAKGELEKIHVKKDILVYRIKKISTGKKQDC